MKGWYSRRHTIGRRRFLRGEISAFINNNSIDKANMSGKWINLVSLGVYIDMEK